MARKRNSRLPSNNGVKVAEAKPAASPEAAKPTVDDEAIAKEHEDLLRAMISAATTQNGVLFQQSSSHYQAFMLRHKIVPKE